MNWKLIILVLVIIGIFISPIIYNAFFDEDDQEENKQNLEGENQIVISGRIILQEEENVSDS